MKPFETFFTLFFVGILALLCTGLYIEHKQKQLPEAQQYRIIVFNADGSINEIYETNRYSSAGPSISFVDQHKGKIEIFNCPTIIRSYAEQQVPLPPKLPPQDRTAEEEGRKAEKAGKELKDNPYEKGTRKHSQWEAGWWTSHDSFFGVS